MLAIVLNSKVAKIVISLLYNIFLNQLFCDDITENNLPFAYNVTTNKVRR